MSASPLKTPPAHVFSRPGMPDLHPVQISAITHLLSTLPKSTPSKPRLPDLPTFLPLLDLDLPGDPSNLIQHVNLLILDFQAAFKRANEISPPLILPDEYSTLFATIEADFPWQYNDCGYKGWQDVKAYRIHPSYPKMPLENVDLSFPELSRVADPLGCHGWFWVTKDFLPYIFPLLAKHGWHFKQIFTWIKTNKQNQPSYGMGYWGRNACEFLIFAIRLNQFRKSAPQIPFNKIRTTTPNTIFAEDIYQDLCMEELFTNDHGHHLMLPKSYHSAKPDKAYELMAALSPGPRLSIFQRAPREGWKCFGWEMNG